MPIELLSDPILVEVIRNAQGRARHAAVKLMLREAALEKHVALLEDEIDRQALLIAALIELCRDRGLTSQEEFANRVKQLDLADGVEDGKRTRSKTSVETPAGPVQRVTDEMGPPRW